MSLEQWTQENLALGLGPVILRQPAAGSKSDSPYTSTGLQKRYTFDNFVVGQGNRFAHAASLRVSASPAQSYNPLYLYGGVGVGKTHLLNAIGNRIGLAFPELRIAYMTCEHFFNLVINAIRQGEPEEFRESCRAADVLLIDDVQFISDKESTQEEFFHTFNSLHEAGKQIVLTSDCSPKRLECLTERLRSRFAWGLVVDIGPADLEMRTAILRRKAAEKGAEVPEDVLQYLARKAQESVRELEGGLNRVLAFATLNELPLTVEVAGKALVNISAQTKPLTPESIIARIGDYSGVNSDDMKGKSRDRKSALPRQIAMYLAREETDASLDKIGKLLGGRDHTTVMHAWHKIGKAIKTDPEIRDCVAEYRTLLYSGGSKRGF